MAVAAASSMTTITGTIVAVDRPHNLVSVRHGPDAAMPMVMTMAVQMRVPRALASLKPGMVVRLHCDTTPNPWVCEVKRAPTR
jgi:Cu/Ag efflux protein CusF